MAKKWMGTVPKSCDLCNKPLKQQFVDGKTQRGPWALMCGVCHSRNGYGIGTGLGQRYDLVTLEKVEG